MAKLKNKTEQKWTEAAKQEKGPKKRNEQKEAKQKAEADDDSH